MAGVIVYKFFKEHGSNSFSNISAHLKQSLKLIKKLRIVNRIKIKMRNYRKGFSIIMEFSKNPNAKISGVDSMVMDTTLRPGVCKDLALSLHCY